MTTPKETCPKCSAPVRVFGNLGTIWECDSKCFADFLQSDRCRISELEKDKTAAREALEIALKETQRSHARQLELERENERFRNNRSEQCVNCMKYTTDWIEPDGAPGRICRSCESLLAKGGKRNE
jgi:hypothetical protein